VHNANKKRCFPGRGEWYVESEIHEAPKKRRQKWRQRASS
jgi:hypothetical protein